MSLFKTLVGSMTNWQRNQWARAGYPGGREENVVKIEPFLALRKGEPKRPIEPEPKPAIKEPDLDQVLDDVYPPEPEPRTEQEEILQLLNAGRTQADVARTLGISKDKVYRVAKKRIDTA